MFFAIFIILLLAAVVFFHYVQGFFSATLSAIIAVISAVVAVGYYESLTEGPLAGMSPNWMPTLVLLGLFAVTYVVLRTLFDKAIPGQVELPAALDKVGGAVMGLVAGAFALGVVVIAAQQLPLGATIGGYGRYETQGEKSVQIPALGRGASKDAATYDEVTVANFDEPDAATKKLLVPLDDIVVGTVAHLSAAGALNAGKPLTEIHPDLLQELFAQRLGMETGSTRTLRNGGSKNAVEVTGIYRAPTVDAARIIDHEFKRIRGGSGIKAPPVRPGEARVVVRIKFNDTAKDEKVQFVRISPGAIRLVGKRPSADNPEEMETHNYYPIGTLDPGGMLYLNKVDDFLFIEVPAKKVAGGGDGPAEVDFVFQVKEQGLLQAGDKPGTARFAPGTFLEVKKQARVDLGTGDAAVVKASMPPVPTLAIKRKSLQVEGGPEPSKPGRVAIAPGATPDSAAGAAPAGGGGGHLGQRLAGTWVTRTGVQVTDTITFTSDGGMNSSKDGAALRWAAQGNPQGEVLNINVTGGASPEKRTITFIDDNAFDMTGADGANRRFTREGPAPAPAGAPAPQPAPQPSQAADPNMAKMVGTWENADQLAYTFGADGNYTGRNAKTNQSGGGRWRVTGAEEGGNVLNIEMITKSGAVNTQRWNVASATAAPAQISRIMPDGSSVAYTKK
jgi:hypothetical protein